MNTFNPYNNNMQYIQSNELILSKDKGIAKSAINRILGMSVSLKASQNLLQMQSDMLKWYKSLIATLDEYFYMTQKYQEYKSYISNIILEDSAMKTSPLSNNSSFSSPFTSSFSSFGNKPLSEEQALAQLKGNIDVIVSVIEEMKSAVSLSDNIKSEAVAKVFQMANPQNESQAVSGLNEKIFIVHGHNEVMKQATARFIEKLNLEAVILSEQANQGNTLIEKFEANSNVGYAVILCSADDIGYAKNKPEEAKPRARQNVVLELGYFFAKLGRGKVAVLVEDIANFEKPSDISGIAYISYDNDGAWQYKLVKELKAQGYAVSADSL